MPANTLGDVRSRVHSLEIQVPWGTPERAIPFTKYIRAYIDRKEGEGWRFERVLRQYREPFANVHKQRGIMAAVYVVDCIFSRRVQEFTLSLPDAAIKKLLAHPRLGKLVTNVS